MNRKIIKYIIIYLCFFSFFSKADELKKVTIQLSWFDQFQFAGYYMAKEKGFYKEAGLDVDINTFQFGLNIPKDVSTGKIDFAVGRETLILDKSNGHDIVALYALFQSTPLILISTKESGINQIEDFINKNIMTTIDDAGEVSLKAMIRSKNVRLEDLNFVKHTHNINDLINKNTDVISAYISKSPYELQNKGIEYNIFDPKNYGFDMYSDLLYTSRSLINNDLATVQAFKDASLRGWKYAYSNIEESVDLIQKKYNGQKLSRGELFYEALELKKLSYFNTNELGLIRKDKIQRIFDLYNIMGLTKEKINFDDFVYTSKDLNKLHFDDNEKKFIKNNMSNIKMCVIPNMMPYSNISENNFEGIASDFIKLVEDKTKLKFEIVKSENFNNSLELMSREICDFIPTLQISDEKKNLVNFTESYLDIPSVLITKTQKPFIENLKNLKNIKVGILADFSSMEILKNKYPKIEFVEVSSLIEGLSMVENDELYGQISTIGSAWYTLKSQYLTNLKISGKIDEKIKLRIGVNKNEEILFSILSKVVASLDKKELERLNNKWIYIEQKKEFDYVLLIQITIIISILILFLLYRQSLLKGMNRELNKKVEEKTEELKKINETLEDRIKKEVDENLKKDRLLARQSKMAAMGQMIENIAHQWRQPLSVISTAASGLKIKKQVNDLDDEFFYNTLDSIVNSTNYLSHTIDDFRYFFKPNDEKTEFSIAKTLDKTINLLNSKFEQENITVVRKFDEVKIVGHETEFIQVFINILNNAKDALHDVNIDNKYIFVEVKKNKNKVIVKIKDNAGGIKPKIMEKIFEPYFTTKHNSQGTGIGLYMCDQIISKYMNGLIEVSNKEYTYKNHSFKGAQFSIILYLNK